jgi:hypothetical protein
LASIRSLYPWLRHIFADGGYAGDKLSAGRCRVHQSRHKQALAVWLSNELHDKGLPIVCLGARHANAALKAQSNKTGLYDAAGLAQFVRTANTPPFESGIMTPNASPTATAQEGSRLRSCIHSYPILHDLGE